MNVILKLLHLNIKNTKLNIKNLLQLNQVREVYIFNCINTLVAAFHIDTLIKYIDCLTAVHKCLSVALAMWRVEVLHCIKIGAGAFSALAPIAKSVAVQS